MLYPNPSKGILHINGMLEENALLSVYDRLWKKVMETKIENDKQVYFCNLKNGIYLANVQNDNALECRKFFIE